MSITIYCPAAPTTAAPCPYCEEARSPEGWRGALDGAWVNIEELSPEDRAKVNCDPWCKGEEVTSTLPEVNWSSANARGVMDLLGLDPESGDLSPEEIPAVLRAIMGAKNRDAARAGLVVPASDERAPARVVGGDRIEPGCRIIGFGNTDEDTLRRLDAFQGLLIQALEGNYSVSWG